MFREYFRYEGTELVRNAATLVFGVAIALLGSVMMTLTSSPIAKGAALLWLPAALQLMAGVWLGPWRGLLAGGLGAYAAGIIAYGGWGLPDIIMNPVAGGFANSLLPAMLFAWFRVDPQISVERRGLLVSALVILVVIAGLVALAIWLRSLALGPYAYVPALVIIGVLPLMVKNFRMRAGDLALGVVISVLISAVSAAFGVWGTMLAGQPFEAAVIGTGVGWFLGDTVSCILGLYALGAFTARARELGIAPIPSGRGASDQA